MKRRIVLSPRAENHLAKIHEYIFKQSGEVRADAVVMRLLEACNMLETFPLRGTKRDDIHPSLRVMGFRRQVIIAFIVEQERIVIHGILTRGQDVNRLFDEEDA